MEKDQKNDTVFYHSTSESSQMRTGHFLPSFPHSILTQSQKESQNNGKSLIDIKSFNGLGFAQRVRYVIKNEMKLAQEYKGWVERQKERIRKTFQNTLEEIKNALCKNERILETLLDCMYQDALINLQDIKHGSKCIFNNHRSPIRGKSVSSLSSKQKYRNKNNAQLIEQLLTQQSELCRVKKVKDYYDDNQEKLNTLNKKIDNFLNFSDQASLKKVETLLMRMKQHIENQVKLVNTKFQRHINEKCGKQWKQSWKKRVKGFSEYGF